MSNQDIPTANPSSTLNGKRIQPRFSNLLQSCRKLAMSRLAERLTELFASVDDTLFECADKAESNMLQQLFFDSMRDIRLLRPQIERSYHKQITQNFTDFLDGKVRTPAEAVELDAGQLSLVQNDDFEEAMQVTNMVSRVRVRSAQALYALDQRLAVLNNGQKLFETDNPFSPQIIADAFRAALQPHPLPLRIKSTLYTLFDKHVMNSLDSMYESVNHLLIEAGVLPNLKYTHARTRSSVRRPVDSPASTGTGAAEQLVSASAQQFVDTASVQVPAEGRQGPLLPAPPQTDPVVLFNELTTLMNYSRQANGPAQLLGGTPSMANFAPSGATRTYSINELIDALNRLQAETSHDITQLLQQPQRVETLKVNLQQQLESFSSSPEQHRLSDQEADVIDLVGMLFDFILDDESLADTYKTTLSHLHTPYLKVALQDKALFTQQQHPARRLLNTMAQSGVLYGNNGDERGLLEKMQWVVERIIHGYAGNFMLFETLLDEFNEYLETLKHKVELREKRAIEVAKGRDKLLSARNTASEVIAKALDKRQPPAIIRNFLELTWIDVLVFVLLRHGEQSTEWKRTGEVAEQLAWSGTLLDAKDLLKLQSLQHRLLEDLRKGLELLGGHHEDSIRRLLTDIVACQHAVQTKQLHMAEQIAVELPESPLGIMLGEDAALMKAAPKATSLSAKAQALAEALEEVEFGTWFEFVENGQSRFLKLSWFSPVTRNYMFVDQSGQRVAIKPLTQLASDMEKGLARIIPPESNAPLMDRALNTIYRVLQRFTSRQAKPSAREAK